MNSSPSQTIQIQIGRNDVLRFAISIGISDSKYLDQLRNVNGGRVAAPPTYYIALGMAAQRLVPLSDLGPDGLPLGEQDPGIRVTAAGTRVQLHDDICVDDVVTISQRTASMLQKNGASGPFTLQTLARCYTRSDGTILVEEQYSRILRNTLEEGERDL